MRRRSFIVGFSAVAATFALPFPRRLGPLAIMPEASAWYGVRDGWTGESTLHYVDFWPTALTHEQMAGDLAKSERTLRPKTACGNTTLDDEEVAASVVVPPSTEMGASAGVTAAFAAAVREVQISSVESHRSMW